MNSTERLRATLSGKPTDRVPISTYELSGFNSQAFENQDPSYKHLMDAIREKTDCVCMWDPATRSPHGNPGEGMGFLPVTAAPLPTEVHSQREGEATVTRTKIHTPHGELTSTQKVFDNVHTVWRTERWCKSVDDVDRMLFVPFEPWEYDFSDHPRILQEVGDHGIIMASLADALCTAVELMEFGDATVWALSEQEHFLHTLDVLHERIMENLRRSLRQGVVELYRICGAEYATPPYMPPEFFRRFVVPYTQDMVELIHCHGAKVRLHCHGKIGHVLDMMLETGADALDPLEAPPDGDILLAEVKRHTAGQVGLFGNLQLKLLEHGSTEQVRNAVARCMDAAKAGGHYVIMPTASPINTPLAPQTEENYLTFFDTALELGQY